ncbi:exodeoxyribonuclease VII small subunit [Lewinella sp. W8]|uniref:exodeoxyribonuclease VII small subunit n=1 Tax=Lewinella sp. W8 TaxID=2528208 RepID=UPI001067309E|nr:exodeoxyribonuclease VII small subunit [Lewinella sp. W8]MTB49885.1 exodeoxyribonuclease VII small subunit [Lewinella sp. W8]
MTYTEAVAELEQLLEQLQEVPTDVDQLYARVARAQELVAACREKLRGVEERLAALEKQSEG